MLIAYRLLPVAYSPYTVACRLSPIAYNAIWLCFHDKVAIDLVPLLVMTVFCALLCTIGCLGLFCLWFCMFCCRCCSWRCCCYLMSLLVGAYCITCPLVSPCHLPSAPLSLCCLPPRASGFLPPAPRLPPSPSRLPTLAFRLLPLGPLPLAHCTTCPHVSPCPLPFCTPVPLSPSASGFPTPAPCLPPSVSRLWPLA